MESHDSRIYRSGVLITRASKVPDLEMTYLAPPAAVTMNLNSNGSREGSPLSRSSTSLTPDLPRDMVSGFRKSAPKSRNGCATCKFRRVKCDEHKPFCDRCTSTGRECDGYTPAKEPKSKKKTRPRKKEIADALPARCLSPISITTYSPSLDIRATTAERRSFHFFRSRKLSSMPGNFEPYFWDALVLQFSHTYPTVQQSLSALGVIYEEHERSNAGLTDTTRASDHALQQYTKAVKTLVEYLSSESQDPRVALISCLIFVWIEFLQKNMDSGFQHLNSGLKILTDLRKFRPVNTSSYSNQCDAGDIFGTLIRSFTRLRVQAAIHGSTSAGLTTSSTRSMEITNMIPASFSSIYESRITLDNEFNAIFGYMRTLRDGDRLNRYEDMSQATIESIKLTHLQRLEQWKIATESMITGRFGTQAVAQNSRLLYLEMYYTFITLAMKTLLQGEMAFDQHTPDFERIVAICEVLIHEQVHEKPPPISFDMGVIPPLFFLVMKCRLLPLRQRAMALLRLAPDQEGMFPRDNLLKIGAWKMTSEEMRRGDTPLDVPLPESARIYQEHIVDQKYLEGGSLMCMQYRRGPPRADDLESMVLPLDMEMVKGMGNML